MCQHGTGQRRPVEAPCPQHCFSVRQIADISGDKAHRTGSDSGNWETVGQEPLGFLELSAGGPTSSRHVLAHSTELQVQTLCPQAITSQESGG